VSMPPRTEWSWLEAYGPVDAGDPSDWATATERVRGEIDAALRQEVFEAHESLMRALLQAPVEEVLHLGSGWGALEERLRVSEGVPALLPEGPRFPNESLGKEQAPWVQLLETGRLPEQSPDDPSGGACVGPAWAARLSADRSWLSLLHQGACAFFEGSLDGARRCWKGSLEANSNAWALRNLAVLESIAGNAPGAAAKLLQALELLPNESHLIDETCRMLSAAGDWEALDRLLSTLPSSLSSRPRVRLGRAGIALARRDLAAVRAYFDSPCDLVDMREAETTLSDLWRNLCEADPSTGDPVRPPWEYDFRMA